MIDRDESVVFSRTGRVASRRRRPMLIAVGVLLAVAGTVGTAAPGHSTYADGGLGALKGEIDWIEWGSDGAAIADGSTSTSTRTINGKPLLVTCTVSGVDGQAEAYRPGRWRGDALPVLYNVGGARDSALVSGIANRIDGQTVRFSLGCSATYDGGPVPVSGLVMSDAESANAAQGEYVQAAPVGGATWRLLDRYRSPGCSAATRAALAADGTLRLDSDSDECTYTDKSWQGPVSTVFMEGATSADFELKGGGRSAIGIGAVLAADFGDAPASYGDAGAFLREQWVGGEIPVGTSNLFTDVQPSRQSGDNDYGLGAIVDSEADHTASDDASWDDRDGSPDEDVVVPAVLDTVPGAVYRLEDVVCGTSSTVVGWVDWNRDGSFGDGERSDVVPCATGSVALTWRVPDSGAERAVSGASFLRLRSAADPAELASPVGMASVGEVEDHAVTLFAGEPRLTVSKVASPESGYPVGIGWVVDYTVTARNTGHQPLDPVTVRDDLRGVVSHADVGVPSATRDGDLVLGDDALTWTGRLDPGDEVTMAYSVVVREFGGDQTLRNTVTATGVPPSGATLSPPPVTTTHPLVPVLELFRVDDGLVVDKGSSPESGSRVLGGQSIEYTVTATNNGLDRLDPATVEDDMVDVLGHAAYSGGASASLGEPPTLVGTTLHWIGVLEPGQSVTLTYSVVVGEVTTSQRLLNTAWATGQPPAGDRLVTNLVSTTHDVEPRVSPPKGGKTVPPPTTGATSAPTPPPRIPLVGSTPVPSAEATGRGALPRTGAEVAVLLSCGAALVVGGSVLVVRRRRATPRADASER